MKTTILTDISDGGIRPLPRTHFGKAGEYSEEGTGLESEAWGATLNFTC